MKYQTEIDWLERIARGDLSEVKHLGDGLCDNYRLRFFGRLGWAVDFSKCQEFSGDRTYPIKSTNKKYSPHEKYLIIEDKYKYAYGKARMKFAQWCADELKKLG